MVVVLSPPPSVPGFAQGVLADREHGLRLIPLPGPHFGGRSAEDFLSRVPARPDVTITFDASAVRSLDAVGLRALARTVRNLHLAGTDVCVCGTSRRVRLLLGASGLHKYAELHETHPTPADAGNPW